MISDSIPNQTPSPESASGTPMTGGTSRPRWLAPVVGAVVLLAIAIGIVAAMTLTGPRQAGAISGGAGYAPADTTMYYEVRLDLPGDQRAKLRAFLGHFPQLNADKYLTDELDAQLDALTASESPSVTYSKDIKPWFNGTIAVALVGIPDFAPSATTRVPNVVIVVGSKDQAAATAASDRLRAEATSSGSSVTSSTHGGATIWVAVPPSGKGQGVVAPAWTITSDAVVFGTTPELVGQSLDAHGGTNLAGRQDVNDAVGRLHSDRIGTAVIDLKALFDGMKTQVQAVDPSMAPLFDGLIGDKQLGVVAEGLRFDNDRIAGDAAFHSSAALPANRDRGLAAVTPGDALFFADGADVGKGLTEFVKGLKAGVAAAGGDSQQLGQIETILGGNAEDFVSWMGDAALVAGSTGGQPYAGIIASPTDASAARTKLQQLQSLLQLASEAGGPQVTVSHADHNGTTITTLQLEATNGVPAWLSSFQWAVTDQRVVIGTGQAFVARVLDMRRADSLAAQTRFQQAVDSVGGLANVGTGWLDLAGIRAAVEPMLPQDVAPMYQTAVRSWLTPLDYVVWGQHSDSGYLDSHAALVVK